MSKREIWRFELNSPDVTINMPRGATPMHVGFQVRAPHALCVWVLVDADAPAEPFPFLTVATGQRIPDDAEYVGTAQEPMTGLVWHVLRPAAHEGERRA